MGCCEYVLGRYQAACTLDIQLIYIIRLFVGTGDLHLDVANQPIRKDIKFLHFEFLRWNGLLFLLASYAILLVGLDGSFLHKKYDGLLDININYSQIVRKVLLRSLVSWLYLNTSKVCFIYFNFYVLWKMR